MRTVNFKCLDEDNFIEELVLCFALMENAVLGNDPIDTVLDETHSLCFDAIIRFIERTSENLTDS